MIRPSWESYFRDIVLCTSTRSSCHRLHVGCILVKDNRIISQGYNGFLSNHPHESVVINDHEIATIHAEQNALIYAVKNHTSVEGATLYVTLSPCLSCARIILTMGIKRVVYLKSYAAYKKLEKDEGVDFLLEFGMEVEAFEGHISTGTDSLI